MSEVTKPIFLDETAQEMNTLLGSLVRQGITEYTTWEDIANIVRKGIASRVWQVGDQFTVTWKDTATGTSYEVPLDVVAFRKVTTENGETKPGMLLQWHYCSPFGVQFDANEAFYYAESVLSAGTYNITMGNGWGKVVSGKTYQFTLTNDLPVGGQLKITDGLPDVDPASWKVYAYANGSTTTATETCTVTEGSDGTNLGTLSSSTKSDAGALNNMQRSGYGYNRWMQSGLRQYLNSSADKGSWWTSQNKYDRVPNECASKNGFMSGFEDDFLAVLGKVQVNTLQNTVSESGGTDTTYDTFFIPSLQECYITPQATGEGEYYPYWKEKSGRSSPCAQYQTYSEMRTFGIDNTANAQIVRLRSAYRGSASYPWFVYSSGGINYYGGATSSYRFAPVCVIC